MTEPAHADSLAATGSPGALQRWAPGLHLFLQYPRGWFFGDLAAGLVLTAVLIPVGMGYAEASGLAAIHGLYATIVPLVAYAVFGPSRIMVLGPDSTLAAVIAAIVLPLSGGSAERALALAGALALLAGGCLLLIGFARLGVMADLFSKPIRIGFINAIALTVIVGQLPKLLGFSSTGDGLMHKVQGLIEGIAGGKPNATATAIGLGSLALILIIRRWRPRWPGVLLAVVGTTAVCAWFDLGRTAQVSVLGPLPQGLPSFTLPLVSAQDLMQLLPGAAIIALLSFADTSVLSRSLAARGGYPVSQDQEMFALGVANLAAGLFQGFPISSSASRTPVAETAGSRSQLTGIVGALAIAALLILAPNLLRHLPSALLGAVVIAACLTFADVPGMWGLYRQRRMEFVLSCISFLGVAFVGVIEGIVITILLALLVLVWNAWHPYYATLVRVDGRRGFHDVLRHPEGRFVPGLAIFRWDAQLFFANAEIFRDRVLHAIEESPTAPKWLVIAADAITDIDITAAESLEVLHAELLQRGIELHFAGLKGPVKDRLAQYGLLSQIGEDHFSSTVGSAVNRYRSRHAVDWKDWDEV
ncbi:MAG TPA: SulP family inorganic anion transporter [Rubrivivax sp.]|nr:SulP family inorganic anion transporter [Rubrivivax sp.]